MAGQQGARLVQETLKRFRGVGTHERACIYFWGGLGIMTGNGVFLNTVSIRS